MVAGATSLQDNPLEHHLGLWDFGRYVKAPDDAKYAFEKVEDLWDYEEADSDDDDILIQDDDNGQDDPGKQPDDDGSGDQQAPPQKKRRTSPRLRRPKELDTTAPKTRRDRAEELYEKVKASKDKVFIVIMERYGNLKKSWHVAKVDWDETDHDIAREKGRLYFSVILSFIHHTFIHLLTYEFMCFHLFINIS